MIRAIAERSPAHARNAGAAIAHNDWILFLDSDCLVHHGLLDAYFALPVSDDVGALAGEVLAAPAGDTLAARYGAARGFLSQEAHLRHPYRPRAVAANLLVRRAAFEQVGGFYEGVRAGEDTDFSWRIQAAGWRLELRSEASVEHRYRTTLRDLRSQWRGYAAGRAWLARRYDGFEPEPALRRASSRAWRRLRRAPRGGAAHGSKPGARRGAHRAPGARRLRAARRAAVAPRSWPDLRCPTGRRARPRGHRRRSCWSPTAFRRAAIRSSNSRSRWAAPASRRRRARNRSMPASRASSPSRTARTTAFAARLAALGGLALTHPLRCALDRLRRGPGEPKLWAIAPAVRRLEHERDARVLALGGADTRATARRIAKLAGRPLDAVPRQARRGGPCTPAAAPDARPGRRPVGVHASLRPRAVRRAGARRRRRRADHQPLRLRVGRRRPTATCCASTSTGTRAAPRAAACGR